MKTIQLFVLLVLVTLAKCQMPTYVEMYAFGYYVSILVEKCVNAPGLFPNESFLYFSKIGNKEANYQINVEFYSDADCQIKTSSSTYNDGGSISNNTGIQLTAYAPIVYDESYGYINYEYECTGTAFYQWYYDTQACSAASFIDQNSFVNVVCVGDGGVQLNYYTDDLCTEPANPPTAYQKIAQGCTSNGVQGYIGSCTNRS